MQIIHRFVFYFDDAYLIRLTVSDVTKPKIMPLPLLFKLPRLPHFSTDLDEISIKIHGLLRSFKSNIAIIRVAVPFKCLI